MESLNYKEEDIEKVLNIINKLPIVTGENNFDLVLKLSTVFQILNNPVKEPIQDLKIEKKKI